MGLQTLRKRDTHLSEKLDKGAESNAHKYMDFKQ